MQASVTSYHLHKDGCSADEYEDAFEIVPDTSPAEDFDMATLRVAIADGASESVLAGRWARSLVGHFAYAAPEVFSDPADFAQHVVHATESWKTVLKEYVGQRESQGRPIKWYEQPKIDRGAYATLLAVCFAAPQEATLSGGSWVAAAIGDCGLFQVREGELIAGFPMTNSEDFGITPALLNSQNRDAELIADRVLLCGGSVEQQDDIYLCTDAVAAWFLGEVERGGRPWELLRDLDTDEGMSFADFVAVERSFKRMRNDDVTLVHVAVW